MENFININKVETITTKTALNKTLKGADITNLNLKNEYVTDVKRVSKKVDIISYLRTLDISVQNAEISGRKFSRHKNPDGTIGGFVEKTAKVAETAYIGPKALVLDKAQVLDSAQVLDEAQISGDARVSGDAKVYDRAKVYDYASISEKAQVYGKAQVFGKAQILDHALVYGGAWVFEHAEVRGGTRISDNVHRTRLDLIGAKRMLRK